MTSLNRIGAILLAVLLPSLAVAEEAVRWASNLDDAKRIAASRNQLVLIHFWADNCPPCRRLDANVFSQDSFSADVAKDYVPVKVNANRDPKLAQQYGVDRWPQDVIVTPSGQVVYRMISPQDQAKYTNVLAQVALKLNPSNSNSMIAQTGNTTIPSAPADQPFVSAAGQDTAAQSRYSKFTGTSAPASGPTNLGPAPLSNNPSLSSRYLGQVASGNSGNSMSPSGSRFTAGTSAEEPAANSGSGSIAPPASVEPPSRVEPRPPASRFASQSGSGHQTEATQPPVSNAAARQNSEPPSPSKQEFAMDGYCPVTLLDQWKWQKGDPRWGAVHQGQVYLFSTQQEQQKFLANPHRYGPAMSGIDPVAYLGQGKVVRGEREFGLTFNGTLYLFSSEENLQQFRNEADRYSSMVRQAMAAQNMQR